MTTILEEMSPTEAMKDGSKELFDLVRVRAASSLYFFAKAIVGHIDLNTTCHMAACMFLQDFDRPAKLYEDPRRHLKSSISTIAYPLWIPSRRIVMGRDPKDRIAIVSSTKTNAQRFLRAIKAVVESNPVFQSFFPELIPQFGNDDVWNSEEIIFPRRASTPDPSIDTLGTGGKATSRHYDIVIEDDLINEENYDSPGAVEKAIESHKLNKNLLESPRDIQHVVENSWAPYDLNRHIVDKEPGVAIFSRSSYGFNPTRSRHLSPKVLALLEQHEPGKPIWPERFDAKDLEKLLQELGPRIFCTPGDAPVLMSDMTYKRIDEIIPGDEVVGFDEEAVITPGKNSSWRRFRRAKVLKVHTMVAPVVELTLASGKKIRATRDHPWFSFSGSRADFGPARVGQSLISVDAETDVVPSPLGYWLGGIFDGEGHAGKCNVYIAQSPEKNPEVCAKIAEAFASIGVPTTRTSTSHLGCDTWYIRGGRASFIKFVRATRPAKQNRILDRLVFGKGAYGEQDKIVSIHTAPPTQVYSLETTTKTYTVWGLLSHNSAQYLNMPSDPDVVDFKEEHLRYFEFNAAGDMRILPRRGVTMEIVPRSSLSVCGAWDPALEEKSTACRSAVCVAGVDTKDRVFLLEVYARRRDPLEMIDDVLRLAKKWQPDLGFAIEDVLFQRVLLDVIRRRAPRYGFSQSLFRGVKPLRGKDKDARIRTLIGSAFAEGRVYIQSVQTDFIEEYIQFPIGKTKDILDAFAYSATLWRRGETVEQVEERFEHERARLELRDPITGY